MSFSKFPFQRNSHILWLPNSGTCAEKLFYAIFFTWSKATWSPQLGEKNNSSHFKWMSSIIGKEEKDRNSQHYHHYWLCTWLVSLSLPPSVHYYALRMRILQFNKDMEHYMKVFEENVNSDGDFLDINFICPSLTLLIRFFVISSLSPAGFRCILFLSFV